MEEKEFDPAQDTKKAGKIDTVMGDKAQIGERFPRNDLPHLHVGIPQLQHALGGGGQAGDGNGGNGVTRQRAVKPIGGKGDILPRYRRGGQIRAVGQMLQPCADHGRVGGGLTEQKIPAAERTGQQNAAEGKQ